MQIPNCRRGSAGARGGGQGAHLLLDPHRQAEPREPCAARESDVGQAVSGARSKLLKIGRDGRGGEWCSFSIANVYREICSR